MNYTVAQDCLPTKSSYLTLGTLYIMPSQNSKTEATKGFQIIGKCDLLIQSILRSLKRKYIEDLIFDVYNILALGFSENNHKSFQTSKVFYTPVQCLEGESAGT